MYNPSQLRRDLKTIVTAFGKPHQHGFYTKWIYDHNNLYVEDCYDGFYATYQGIPIDIETIAINGSLGKLVLDLMVRYEERYYVYKLIHEDGSESLFT
jgi:hypothetical protein